MLTENARLTLTAVCNGDVVRSTELAGERAFLQLTYEWGKTFNASHDFAFEGQAIDVHPQGGSVLEGWSDLTSLSELRVGVAGEEITLVFYSLNGENPDLTCEDHIVLLPGPVVLRGGEIVRADTGERVAFLNRTTYWQFGGKNFSDVCLSRSQDCVVRDRGESPAADPEKWSVADARQASSEGWGVFNEAEIQRDDEADAFETDDDAIRWVRFRAESGSGVHQRALAIHEGGVGAQSTCGTNEAVTGE